MIFLALHIANHLMLAGGEGMYDAVMKVFRHVYRSDILQPLVVALFLFQIGTGLFFVWRLAANRELTGKYANGRTFNALAAATVLATSTLSLLLLGVTFTGGL